MYRIWETGALPIYSWADEIESTALEQAINVAHHPHAVEHVALMPDAHAGMGVPIGCVFITENVVVPNAVGVDIGCGVAAKNTGLPLHKVKPLLPAILKKIRELVPVGFDHHKKPQEGKVLDEAPRDIPVVKQEWDSARHQLGTLGGGNHFIEFSTDEDDTVWILVHSGSRNVGLKVANYFQKIAKEENKKDGIDVPPQLNFLHLQRESGRDYMRAMQWCVEFAATNRKLIMLKAMEALAAFTDFHFTKEERLTVENCIHNYAAAEKHFGRNVIVHRKGAINASAGRQVVIPGSMETFTFIGVGQGNKYSFNSCSHGAGRTMSRTKARDTVSSKEVLERLKSKGIELNMPNPKNVVDESAESYKDIHKIMEQQSDLVKPVHVLTPVGVIKGD